MRLRSLFAVISIVCGCGSFVACGEDEGDDAPSRARGGAAGQGATGGKAGGGGKIAGGAGGSVGGTGGSSGSNAGPAGAGGVAGGAGAAGQTSAGAAGQTSAGAAGQTSGGAAGSSIAGAGGTSSAGAAGQASAGAGGQPTAGAGGQATGGGGGATPDPFTYLYQANGNFVRYRPEPSHFEKSSDYQRDVARKMMPIDLHSWSIANFAADRRMFTDFRLQNASNEVLFEIHDLEGAIHGQLAETPHDEDRGNNHQPDLARFRVAEGDYTVVFTLLAGSKGRPELIVWRQKPDNLFAILVGAAPSEDYGTTIDGKGYLVGFGETVTRTFHVTFVDEDNVIYKSNANGFEAP